MNSTLVLASRTYQPVTDVDAVVSRSTVAFGAMPVALRAESLGAVRRPLETTRATLLALAAEPDTEVVMFVARDPTTKMPTEGIAGIQNLLANRGIPFRVVSSPFPSRVCALITEFSGRTERAKKALPGYRQQMMTQKVLELAAKVVDERDSYASKLEAGKSFMVGDPAMDAKYGNWIRIYTNLCDALEQAKCLLHAPMVVK